MPYVFITSVMPFHKAEELAKIYVGAIKEERKLMRGLGKEIIPNAVKANITPRWVLIRPKGFRLI